MKNTFRVLFAVVLALSMCVCGFALTLDSAEAATETAVVPEAALAATYTPGINVVTGTVDLVTFDEENAADYAATFTSDNYDSKEIVDLPDMLDANGTKGNALQFFHAKYDAVNGEVWHTIKQAYNGVNGTRKFHYTADFAYYIGEVTDEMILTVKGELTDEEKAEITPAKILDNRWAVFQSMTTNGSGHVDAPTAVNTWAKWNINNVPKEGYSVRFRHRAGTGATGDVGACKVDLYAYVDNFGIYPYYKVTYMNGDAELSSEWYLLDGNGNIATTFAPSIDNYPADTVDADGNNVECIGWSTTEGATEPMAVVNLANADVVLYPVWAQKGIIDATADWIRGTKNVDAGGIYESVTVTATEGYTIDSWSVDVGNTNAEYEITDYGVMVTAAGYNGVVKVTATSGDITATKEIRIVGREANNFLPGVNLLTGTKDAWTFDYTSEENGAIGYVGRSAAYATEADGNKYVSLNWTGGTTTDPQTYPQYIFSAYPKETIGDRPIEVNLDYKGAKGNFWILSIDPATNNGGTNVNLNSQMGNATTWTNGKYKLTAKSATNQLVFQMGLTQAQAAYCIDNVSITPYYKVTYYDLSANEVATEYVLPENGVYVPDTAKVTGATGFATEFGGEAVAAVYLTNSDINLFAVNEGDIMNFITDDGAEKVILDGSAYTIPTAEELGFNVENFRLWTDGTNNYYAGDVYEDTTALVGKNLTPLCFTAPLFDPAKGELVFFFDYEGVTDKDTPTYLNKNYATGTASRWDGNSLGTRQLDADGNAVCFVRGGDYQLFGYGINYNEKTVGGKTTIDFDFKYITVENYKTGSNFMRMLSKNVAATADEYYNVGISMPSDRFDGKWHHAVSTRVDTNNWGLKGGIAQYQGLPANSEQMFDNYAFYFYPAKTFAFMEAEGSDEYEVVKIEGDTYTMPVVEGVVAWTDGAGSFFKPGATYTAAEVQHKGLYPYVQNADVPAVIFAYEGTTGVDGSKVTQGNGTSSYGENIVDDGRTVLHLHAWNKKANKDYRLTFKHAEQYDVKEYKHFQFVYKTNNVYKVDETAELGYSPEEKWASCVYVNYNGSGGYYNSNPYVLYQFNSRNYTAADANDYVMMEYDLSTIGTKDGYPIGYGFAIDPVNSQNARWGQDIYIDYIRVYRAGITTVTYDTNAPEGAAVLAEVPADTNRGLGTGYYLKGMRPAVEGYTFRGWALTPDATVADVIECFDLTGDTTVYAVWTANEAVVAPEKNDTQEIRGGETSGIRFKATIKNSDKANLEEFGFIATREALLPTVEGVVDTDALTFNFKKDDVPTIEGSKLYVTGVAYDKDGDIDMINGEETDGSIIYTAVATGIPASAKLENLVMRTYAKYNVGGNEFVVYGGAMINNLYAVAEAIKNENGEAYKNNKAYIDSILAD